MQAYNASNNDNTALMKVVRDIGMHKDTNGLPVLIEMIQKNMDRYDRKELLLKIVDTLEALQLNEAAPALLRTLTRTSAFEVQKRILKALQTLPHETNLPQLEKLVCDREKISFVRSGALDALVRIRSKQIARILARLVYKLEERGDHALFEQAKQHLVEHGESALLSLVEDLSSPDPLVKLYAAKALGDLGNKEAIPSLRKVVQEKSGKVSKVAAESALLLYMAQ